MEPLISVLVPVYNTEEYLPRCINSILQQTYHNLELILVDDASTDRSGSICDEYAEKDSRVRVNHKINEGVAAARNTALQMVMGEYIMFVDSDDYIPDDALQSMYDAIVRDGSDMAIGKHIDVYDDGREVNDTYRWMSDVRYSKKDVFEQISYNRGFQTAPWGKLYKRELFEDILYPPLTMGEDTWVCPLLLDKCDNGISVIGKTIYFYYQRPTSIMHVKSFQSRKDSIIAWLHIVKFLLSHGYILSAQALYGKVIKHACSYRIAKFFIDLTNSYFNADERKTLVKNQRMIIKLLYFWIHVPFLRGLLDLYLKIKHRGRK